MNKKIEIETIIFPDEYKVLAADLSLRRPGFCLLELRKTQNDFAEITKIDLMSVNNKNASKKSHGELLDDIIVAFQKFCPTIGTVYLVRETEVMKMKVPSERSLSKVVGIMDWAAWWTNKEWYSIYPTSVKKLITGSGKAEKNEVAEALEKYVGKQDYKCDDESDATAVAIAWLIQQGQIKQKECLYGK